MGNIAHLRKHPRRRRNFVIVFFYSVIHVYLNPYHPKMVCANLVEIGPVILGKKIFKFSLKYFHYFVIISPWKRTRPFIWTNVNSLHQMMLYAKFGWNKSSGSEDFFEISLMYFAIIVIISPWKKMGPFIWTNLNPNHPRMLCTKFGWNWSSGSGEEKENGKSLRQRGRTTDKLWSEKLTWAFDSGELKTYTHYSGWNPFNQKGTDDITWGPSILKYLLIRR